MDLTAKELYLTKEGISYLKKNKYWYKRLGRCKNIIIDTIDETTWGQL